MAKTRILLLRHADVENPDKVVYGRLPMFPISNKGIKATEILGKSLQSENIDFIYTSPLLRTRQTASIIGKILHKKPVNCLSIIEVDILPIEGIKTSKFQKEIEPNMYTATLYKKGLETIEHIQKRMMHFVRKILKTHPGKTILAVTHGDPIVILRAYLERKHFDYKYKLRHYIPKGEYLILEKESGTYDIKNSSTIRNSQRYFIHGVSSDSGWRISKKF